MSGPEFTIEELNAELIGKLWQVLESLDRINANVQEFNTNAKRAVETIKTGRESNPRLN